MTPIKALSPPLVSFLVLTLCSISSHLTVNATHPLTESQQTAKKFKREEQFPDGPQTGWGILGGCIEGQSS